MTAPRLAGALFGLWLVLAMAPFAFSSRVWLGFLPAVFAGVGVLVAARRSGNPFGWLLIATALAFTLINALQAYSGTRDDAAPAAMWVEHWIGAVWLSLVCIWIPLLYPDGGLPSSRWRPVAWLAAAALAVGTLGTALGAGALETEARRTVANPYALPGSAGDAAGQIASVAEPVYGLLVLAALAALIVRTRRSRGIERQQLKWFVYVGALMLGALGLALIGGTDPELDTVEGLGWFSFLALVMLGLPLAMGMAILRHRLYDIDVVINRTLVYGALTATLAATYLALVLLLGLTVGESDLATAASTLAVAALFRPARAHIQAAVDRRFYRRRYDAALTLDAFAARLRDQVDLDALGADLRGVVAETVQPAHATLWLRDAAR